MLLDTLHREAPAEVSAGQLAELTGLYPTYPEAWMIRREEVLAAAWNSSRPPEDGSALRADAHTICAGGIQNLFVHGRGPVRMRGRDDDGLEDAKLHMIDQEDRKST